MKNLQRSETDRCMRSGITSHGEAYGEVVVGIHTTKTPSIMWFGHDWTTLIPAFLGSETHVSRNRGHRNLFADNDRLLFRSFDSFFPRTRRWLRLWMTCPNGQLCMNSFSSNPTSPILFIYHANDLGVVDARNRWYLSLFIDDRAYRAW